MNCMMRQSSFQKDEEGNVNPNIKWILKWKEEGIQKVAIYNMKWVFKRMKIGSKQVMGFVKKSPIFL